MQRTNRNTAGWGLLGLDPVFAHLASWPVEVDRLPPAVPGWRGSACFAIPGRAKTGGPGGGGDASGGGGDAYHVPVLADEVVQFLAPGPGKLIVDGTLGAGGHSERLLEAGACVLGLDHDPDAIETATARLAPFRERVAIVRANFRDFPEILTASGVTGADGFLVDLGVSSWQLDQPARGFSFQADGPLDMRMDPAGPLTAADLVNRCDESELADLFWKFGEEKASRKIARAVVAARASAPVTTTLQLASLVERIIPRRGKKTHPATRVFQALRIAVNDELGALEDFLAATADWLRPGGRVAVITFHSLEDRVVKNFFRSRSDQWLDRPEWPEPRPNPHLRFRLPVRKPVAPTRDECAANPRARSAKLRIVERLP